MHPDSNLTLTGLLVKRWRLCLTIFMLCIGLAGLAFCVIPRKYEASMKLLVKNERADLVLTPGKNSSDAERTDVNENEVNSEMELLRSRDILEAVTRDAQLYRTPGSKSTQPPTPLILERAVDKLGRTLNVSPIRKTNIIAVTYRSSTPDKAAYVVRDLGDRYLNAHLSVHSAPGSYKFFAEESAKFRDELKNVQGAIYEFHHRTHIFSMPQQSTAVVARLEETKAQLNDLDIQIHEEETRAAKNQSELGNTPERLTTQVKEVPNPMAAQQLQTMLTDLQNRRIAMAVKFKPTDRAVVELDREIQNTKQALTTAQTAHLSEETSDVNTVHQSLSTDLIKTRIQLEGHKGMRSLLAQTIGQYTQRLDNMDENASTLQELEQAERQAEENYSLYSRRLEEARMAESLDQQKFSNVTIIENPVASPIPVTPKLGFTLGIGVLMGLVLALATAFLLESGKAPAESSPETSETPSFQPVRAYSASSGD